MSVSEWTEGLKKERRFSLYRQPLSHDLRRASSPAGEPFGALYKLPHKTNKGTASRPHFFIISHAYPPSGGFRRARKRAYGFAVFAAAAGIMVPSALTYTLSTLAPERVIR